MGIIINNRGITQLTESVTEITQITQITRSVTRLTEVSWWEPERCSWWRCVVDVWTIGPGGLNAPCVLACAMRSLAIVITIIQSSFL